MQHRNSPKAALIPPCAATVCDRVGKSFVMTAVLKPSATRPNAARSPAPPAPTTTASYVWSIMGYSFEIASVLAVALLRSTDTCNPLESTGRVEPIYKNKCCTYCLLYLAKLCNKLRWLKMYL